MKLAILGVAALTLAAGCASTRPTTPATTAAARATTTISAPKCPSHTPPMSTFDTDVAHAFVRPGAQAMRLCRYEGFNGRDPRGLRNQRLVGDRVTIGRITRAFNELREVRGVYHCPADLGGEVLVIFAFPHAPAERVAVQLSGCRFATNGGRAQQVRWMSPRLRHRLLNLVAEG